MLNHKTARFFLLLLFLALHQIGSAQIVQELKSDLFALGNLDPNLTWEINTQKRWSASLELRYTFTKWDFNSNNSLGTTTPNSPTAISTLRFKWQYFSISPSFHYYFSERKKNHGLFTGITNITEVNTYLDPAYYQVYKEQYPTDNGYDDGLKRFFVGIPLGYKWLLIKDQLVLELALVYGGDYSWWTENSEFAYYGTMRLKAGYRFLKKK